MNNFKKLLQTERRPDSPPYDTKYITVETNFSAIDSNNIPPSSPKSSEAI